MTVSFTRLEGLGASPIAASSPDHALLWDYYPDRDPDWLPLATVACSAGHLASISPKIHTIAADGTLSPSYVCPQPDCDFHEFVRFEGWQTL